jgi:integrase
MVERQQRNLDGTWTLSEHTSGMVVVLEHEVPLDELYDGVALAANRGWVPHSAAIECVPPLAAQSEPRTRWLSHDEFPKMLDALDTTEWMAKRVSGLEPAEADRKLHAHRAHVADRQLFVMVACLTGAELSALSRLDWTDVEFTTGRIRLPGTKNATRNRTIDLDPQLAAALRRVPPARRVGPVLRPWANACTISAPPATALASTRSRRTPFATRLACGSFRPGSTPSWSAS